MTLKQIITRLEQLALSQKQIKTFFVGGSDEFLDNQDVVYPACFVELKPDHNVSLENRIANFNFTIYFFDLLDIANNALKNRYEIISDMSSIAQDYISLIYDREYKDWEINEDFNSSVTEYQLQDLVSGISFDISIGKKYDANLCEVPTSLVFEQYQKSNLTLKQVITRIKTLALSHKQINTFFIGSFNEFLDGDDVTYPACFCELNTSGVFSITERMAKYTFTFYLFDLLDISNNALKNEWEVKSDMHSVALDVISMLNYVGYQHSWIIDDNYDVTISDYQLQDLTSGVSFKIEIATRFDANLCEAVVERGNFLLWNDTDKFLINSNDKLIIFD